MNPAPVPTNSHFSEAGCEDKDPCPFYHWLIPVAMVCGTVLIAAFAVETLVWELSALFCAATFLATSLAGRVAGRLLRLLLRSLTRGGRKGQLWTPTFQHHSAVAN
jgi:hypothetical protein